jgi:hypothetical protein
VKRRYCLSCQLAYQLSLCLEFKFEVRNQGRGELNLIIEEEHINMEIYGDKLG